MKNEPEGFEKSHQVQMGEPESPRSIVVMTGEPRNETPRTVRRQRGFFFRSTAPSRKGRRGYNLATARR